MEKTTEILVNVNCHPHTLYIMNDKKKWYCDSITLNISCGRQHKKSLSTRNYQRYSCLQCSFCLCDRCAFNYRIEEEKEIFIETSEHPHPLKFYRNVPLSWYCDMVANGKKCLRNHAADYEYRNEITFFCKPCSFFLCDLDAKEYSKDKNLFENIIESGKNKRKSTSNSNKCLELREKKNSSSKELSNDKKNSKKNAIIIVKVSVHPHPLHLQHAERKWLCDVISLGKICGRKHTDLTVPKDWNYKKYLCENGCEFGLCDICTKKYQINMEPEQIIQTTVHEHPLKYFVNCPTAWYCDMLSIDRKCLREHKKEYEYRDLNVYICIMERCNFFLCDLDAKQYQIIDHDAEKCRKQDLSEENDLLKKKPKELKLIDDSKIREKYGNDVKIIGKGGLGSVILALNDQKKKIAVKIIETYDPEQNNNNIKELLNLSRLSGNENIMSYISYNLNTLPKENKQILHQLEIQMEYAENNLSAIIKNSPDSRIDEKQLLFILKQIANGLSFAHKQKCVHLDLKPANILFVALKCKIADWGGSLILTNEESKPKNSHEFCYTKGYVAPELLELLDNKNNNVDYYKCDIYSLGIMILRCCGAKSKFIQNSIPIDDQFAHDKIIKDFLEIKLMNHYSKKFCKIINKLCKFSPEKRPFIQKVQIMLEAIK